MPDQPQDQLKLSLDATGLPPEHKAALWKAYQNSSDSKSLNSALDAIPVPDDIKAAVFDVKAAVAQGQQPNFGSFPKTQTVAPPATPAARAPKPTMGDDIETGLKSGAWGGLAKLAQMTQIIAKPIEAVTGIPIATENQKKINQMKQYSSDASKGHDSVTSAVASGVASAPSDIARFATTYWIPLPPAAKMAIVEALTENDNGLGNSIWAGIKGGTTGLAMGKSEKLADSFIQKYAASAPDVVKRILSKLGAGGGMSATNQVANLVQGDPISFKAFVKDAISGAGVATAVPLLTPKILSQSKVATAPPPVATAPPPVVTGTKSNPHPMASNQTPHPLAVLSPAPNTIKPPAPAPNQQAAVPEVAQTAMIPVSKPTQKTGSSRFNVSPEGETADTTAAPIAPKQIQGAVAPPPVEVLPQQKALPPSSKTPTPQLPAATEKSAAATEELRGATGLNADKGVIYDLSALPTEELLAIRPVAQKAYDVAQDNGTRSQAAARLNAVNFLLFNKAVAGEAGLEPAQAYRDSHIHTPEPVQSAPAAATPTETPAAETPITNEQIAVNAGGSVKDGVMSDEHGVPTMLPEKESKTVIPDETIKVKADKPVAAAKPAVVKPVEPAKPAVKVETPTPVVKAEAPKPAAPKVSPEVTEIVPDPKTMKIPTVGGSMKLAKGDTAYSHNGKVYVATPKGKEVVIENEDGMSVTKPLSGTVAETVAAHLGASYKPAGTLAPPAKQQSTQSQPSVSRSKDFKEDGSYDVALPDGKVIQIARDTGQFTYPVWYVSGKNTNKGGGTGTAGYTKEEAIAHVVKNAHKYESEVSVSTPKGAPVENKPAAKTASIPPVQKEAAPKTKAAGSSGGESVARTASVPVAKASKEVEQPSKPAVSESETEHRDALGEYEKSLIDTLDKLKGSQLHSGYKQALQDLIDNPTPKNRKSFLDIKAKAEVELGNRQSKGTGKLRAEKMGSEANVIDADGNIVGKAELIGSGEKQKIRFTDKDGKHRETRDFQDGQWNEKALSNISREIWK